ncbi:hypothetical protein [Vibrio aestuarianus]|uniref:hypothetical protein n=1 Tax=Vibrio aestuarianus TaxID=28171 RepID=UPI0015591A8F|nr:hypothetical protein [Vibrio aestuarianus]MDE1211101.1 hypothetical protein [Vibrio aestuarianus]MDE1349232.1 hypothetical protein [Vibrio aestuarianus]NGZ12648.1 hypothetical protein [Vibrio aestuarianus]NKZ48796.1 hypothetical protein [Vibrio aestuarianus]
MKVQLRVLTTLLTILLISSCANETKLGHHVSLVRAEQTYNPKASQDNLGVVPTGSGERMEGAYQSYTGKSESDLSSSESESQFLDGFSK